MAYEDRPYRCHKVFGLVEGEIKTREDLQQVLESGKQKLEAVVNELHETPPDGQRGSGLRAIQATR